EEMAALAYATEPGPWSSATHRYGPYYGIRIGGRLASMAGERMRLPGLAELSGVSTWPEFRGQGLAAALVRRVVRGVLERGDTPGAEGWCAGAAAGAAGGGRGRCGIATRPTPGRSRSTKGSVAEYARTGRSRYWRSPDEALESRRCRDLLRPRRPSRSAPAPLEPALPRRSTRSPETATSPCSRFSSTCSPATSPAPAQPGRRSAPS